MRTKSTQTLQFMKKQKQEVFIIPDKSYVKEVEYLYRFTGKNYQGEI